VLADVLSKAKHEAWLCMNELRLIYKNCFMALGSTDFFFRTVFVEHNSGNRGTDDCLFSFMNRCAIKSPNSLASFKECVSAQDICAILNARAMS
jgi:hypothetical protein